VLHVFGLHSYYREGKRVTENFTLFHHLMDSAMGSCSKCCTAWFLFSHFIPDVYHASRVRKAKPLARNPVLSVRIVRIAIGNGFDHIIERPFLTEPAPSRPRLLIGAGSDQNHA
jgi:hypothetical protein